VNPGSEPERDDTGLPPVDVEIPDDARELDRDVQAYHREQRAQRRHLRSIRLRRTLTRDGMVLPVLACCLVFALIAGTVLTLFSTTSMDQGLPGTARAGQSGLGTGDRSAGATPAVTMAPSKLAAATLRVGGHPYSVRSLRPAVLLVMPPECACNGAIAELASLAVEAGARAYLVAGPADIAQSVELAGELGDELLTATDDTGTVLGSAYPHAGLTAILIGTGGTVSYAQRLQDADNLAAMLREALL